MEDYKKIQEKWEQEQLFELAKKSSDARRWKKDSYDPYRTEYQRDVGRILYSDAFRRLRMKTQVFVASGLDQHNRTRLTHSLEVNQIAKSIARPLRLNVDLTEAIALAHDLGHTPFGHAGESALNKCLVKKGSFNHNVQSVWILRTSLLFRKDINGNFYPGFNLAHDTVEGVWKHTKFKETIDEYKELKYYYPEKPSSLEGQTVDIADGIAYIRHDIEDAMKNGLINLAEIKEVWESNTDIPFDSQNWFHVLIHDVIASSINKDKIAFSKSINSLYEKMKEFIFENIIKSDLVRQKDQEGKEKIQTIFEYCMKNPDYILNKYPVRNMYLYENESLERVAVDFIQWLGDELASEVYFNIIKKAI